MAINAARGLPSFSEMLQGYRNKGGLGDALKAGLEGYDKGRAAIAAEKKAVGDAELQQSEIKKNLAAANKDPLNDMVDIRGMQPNMKPEQFQALKMTATQTPDGRLLVSKNTVSQMIPLVRQQSSEDMARAGQEAAEKRSVAAMIEARRAQQEAENERNNRANKVQQETNARMAQGQALTAAESTLKEGSKRSGIKKVWDKVVNTDTQKELDRAQQVRSQAIGSALNKLQPGETAMINPATGDIVSVTPEEMGAAIQQGYQQVNH